MPPVPFGSRITCSSRSSQRCEDDLADVEAAARPSNRPVGAGVSTKRRSPRRSRCRRRRTHRASPPGRRSRPRCRKISLCASSQVKALASSRSLRMRSPAARKIRTEVLAALKIAPSQLLPCLARGAEGRRAGDQAASVDFWRWPIGREPGPDDQDSGRMGRSHRTSRRPAKGRRLARLSSKPSAMSLRVTSSVSDW